MVPTLEIGILLKLALGLVVAWHACLPIPVPRKPSHCAKQRLRIPRAKELNSLRALLCTSLRAKQGLCLLGTKGCHLKGVWFKSRFCGWVNFYALQATLFTRFLGTRNLRAWCLVRSKHQAQPNRNYALHCFALCKATLAREFIPYHRAKGQNWVNFYANSLLGTCAKQGLCLVLASHPRGVRSKSCF